MTHIVVLGGTGYAGGNIVAEAAKRGFDVTSWSRSEPKNRIEGVSYRTGNLQDADTVNSAVEGADVIIAALSPRGPLDGKLRDLYNRIYAAAEKVGARLGVVGGAGSLQVTEGGPLLYTLPDFDEAYRSEAQQLSEVLEDLRAWEGPLDWFLLSPAGGFGAHAPGKATGKYRLGTDALLVDAEGNSNISGADFAKAFVDEISEPAHRRTRFTVAY